MNIQGYELLKLGKWMKTAGGEAFAEALKTNNTVTVFKLNRELFCSPFVVKDISYSYKVKQMNILEQRVHKLLQKF